MRLKIAILTIVNLIAFIALLYMFDIFGVVNYYTLMRTKIAPNVPGFLNRFTQKARVEDMSLLARDDLNKMRESFNLREKDIQAQESLIASKAIELNTQSELIEQDRQNLLNAWSNYQATMDESSQYQLVLSDLANKVNSMPPQNSVALLNQLAANGSDDLVIDVLLEMDAIAAAEGRNSTTSYLLSLMDPTVAARILEKYEARSNPGNNTVPSSPNDFPNYLPDEMNNDAMLNEGIMDMDAFIAVTGSTETNILSCLHAHKQGVKKTIALVENVSYIDVSQEIGIDTIINKKLITASYIARFTLAANVTSSKWLSGIDAEVVEVLVKEGAPITKRQIMRLDLPEGVSIGGVIRSNVAYIAKGDFQIQPGDKVVAFTIPESANKLMKLFN